MQQAAPYVAKRHSPTSYEAENLDVRFLRKAGLRYDEWIIAPGAQTERRGDGGPVRVSLAADTHRPLYAAESVPLPYPRPASMRKFAGLAGKM
jgi:hypothetical protein